MCDVSLGLCCCGGQALQVRWSPAGWHYYPPPNCLSPGISGLCAAEPVQLWEAETQQGFHPHKMPMVVLAQHWEGAGYLEVGVKVFFFLLRDHPKDSLGGAAEVCSSSAFTAPCLPSVVLSVCLRSRKHLSEEQDKCSALMCVFSLGIVGFVPGELACRLRYLMVAWREVVQLFWLPQHDPH